MNKKASSSLSNNLRLAEPVVVEEQQGSGTDTVEEVVKEHLKIAFEEDILPEQEVVLLTVQVTTFAGLEDNKSGR
jgi:hypothetical protein